MKSEMWWEERIGPAKNIIRQRGRSVVPGVAITMKGILGNGQSAASLPETHSSLIGEGHGTVQAVLTPKHAMSMKDLHRHRKVSHPPKGEEPFIILTSIFLACQPTPLATFPLASDNLCSSSLQGCSSNPLFSSPPHHPVAVSTYHPLPPLLLMILHVPAPAPNPDSIGAANSTTLKFVGALPLNPVEEVRLNENGGVESGRMSLL